eukprot:364657_1
MVYILELKKIADAKAYAAEATQERCFILSYTSQDCSYECSDANSDDAVFCDSTNYIYTATVSNKCGNQILTSKHYSNTCPESLKNINQTYKCYVLDCEDSTFSFNHHTDITNDGAIIIAFSAIGLIIGTLVCGLFVCAAICITKSADCCTICP